MVKAKRRSGFIRTFDVPLKRSEGALAGRRKGALAGAKAAVIRIPPAVRKHILEDRNGGLTLMELRSKYGHGLRVIQRILKDGDKTRPNQI